MVWGDDGWLRTIDGDGIPSLEADAPRGLPPQPLPPPPAREDFDGAHAADRFPVAAIAVARRVVQPDRAPGTSCGCTAAKRSAACSGRRSSRGGSSRTATARRRSSSSSRGTSSRWPAWSATTTAPSSTTSTSRRDDAAGKHLRVMSALPDQAQADAFTPPHRRFRRTCRSSCGSRSTTSGCTSPIASAAPNGRGCRSSSTPASSPTKPPRRGCRTSPGAFVGMACQDMSGAALSGGFRLVRVPSSGHTASIRSDVINESFRRR